MEQVQSKQLRFLQSILTQKERKWLKDSNHPEAFRFRRLNFMLQNFSGDANIESMIGYLLLDIISNKTAYLRKKS